MEREIKAWRGFCLGVMVLIVLVFRGEGHLARNFYSSTCPNVETIVRQAVQSKFSQTSVTAQATIRLFFHDCFVEGCDGSILIASPNGDAEKDASDNISLAGDGFDTVARAKQAVEAQCPGVVSCADILALATRDSVVLTGGPFYEVETGRLDGLISQASRVAGNLPEPTFDLSQLTTLFMKNNLSRTDMIALSGAHTIGASHCNRFASRLYSFSASFPVDPSLNLSYAQQLKQDCPPAVDPNIVASLDPTTPMTFDNVYYQNLVNGKGLLPSDQLLFIEPASRPTVINFAGSSGQFNRAFVKAIRRLGRVGLKIGSQGQIRRDCSAFNP